MRNGSRRLAPHRPPARPCAGLSRYQGDGCSIFIPRVRCHPFDLAQGAAIPPAILQNGILCRASFACTEPCHRKGPFQCSPFMDVDVARFLPDFS